MIALSMLVSIGLIAPAILMPTANASGSGNPKAAQSDKERTSAQAKKSENMCQELQPCIGDKLVSIEAILRDISGLIAAVAFADPASGTFTNVAPVCKDDKYNAFFDNTAGATDKEVTAFIKNSGECLVELSVSAGEGSAPARNPEPKTIGSKNNNGQGAFVSYVIPKGMYLRAICNKTVGLKCEYKITQVTNTPVPR